MIAFGYSGVWGVEGEKKCESMRFGKERSRGVGESAYWIKV